MIDQTRKFWIFRGCHPSIQMGISIGKINWIEISVLDLIKYFSTGPFDNVYLNLLTSIDFICLSSHSKYCQMDVHDKAKGIFY